MNKNIRVRTRLPFRSPGAVMLTCAVLLMTSGSVFAVTPAGGQVAEIVPHPVTVVDSVELKVFFPQGMSVLVPSYMNNEDLLKHFTRDMRRYLADTTLAIRDIVIHTGASPEGSVENNWKLSVKRGESVRSYLSGELSLPDSVFVLEPVGEDWTRLAEILVRYRTPSYEKVLEIIDACPLDACGLSVAALERRKSLIKNLDDGKTWDFLLKYVFPELRGNDTFIVGHFVKAVPEWRDTVYVIQRGGEASPGSVGAAAAVSGAAAAAATVEAVGAAGVSGDAGEEAASAAGDSTTSGTTDRKRYQMAVKSNLLFDVTAALNVEVEFPIGRRMSVMGELWFPCSPLNYLLRFSSTQCMLYLHSASVEGRYWFARRRDVPVLTGWYAGVYGGALRFDCEYDSKGYQCRLCYGGGLSGGYSLPIGRDWRIEMSLAVGYLHGTMQYYEQKPDGGLLIWKRDEPLNWFGPTKAKVSLTWLLPSSVSREQRQAERAGRKADRGSGKRGRAADKKGGEGK